jgi:hypothetical protein
MSDNTIPPVDLNRENMIYYLRQLSQGLLDREGAQALRPLLQIELETAQRQGNIESIRRLTRLIQDLDLYITGRINLYSGIGDNIGPSNVN